MTDVESLAISVAETHVGATGDAPPIRLLALLELHRKQIETTYRATAHSVQVGHWISPAAEWLIDNFHVVREQLRESREDLPRKFWLQLPRLGSGEHAGLPRAFAITEAFFGHTDAHLDMDVFQRFLSAYQTVSSLTIGELWAIPIALRHSLLRRLAAIAVRVDRARTERKAAAALAEDLLTVVPRGPEAVQRALEKHAARRINPSTTMFATELLLRVRDQDPAMAPAVAWLESRISEQGTSLDDAIRLEHQSQAATQVSVGNTIGSMRTITATDWRRFFEKQSRVEHVLDGDPSGDYALMDFATRDRYRHAVEQIAKRSPHGEVQIADHAVALAAAATDRKHHVGYYLIGAGRPALEAATAFRPSLAQKLGRLLAAHATPAYLGSIGLVTIGITAMLVGWLGVFGVSPMMMAFLAVLAILPTSELAVSLVNLCISSLLTPRSLPKLDFLDGLPRDCRTLVVVPTMLGNPAATADLLDDLEVRHLANRDAHLHFALCTDFSDAPTPHQPSDDANVQAARRGIERLNAMHGKGTFFLFHRRRLWNEGEGVFMGWERKRGKLDELNRLLLGDTTTSFDTIVGNLSELSDVRYILTLDTDTRLPRDAAKRLIGTMAHPLNRPRLDPDTGLVVEGYAIMQPRVSVALDSSQRSRFARLHTDQPGIDPYTSAVSDLYQDVFAEGSFVGKGIYDLRAFSAALKGRIPANTVLSHDLLEGLFARAALVSDIELFDETPSHYLGETVRRHRWIRGDWQIAPWLMPTVPTETGTGKNPLSIIGRWKILDNLRRSLIPPAMLVLLLAGWLVAVRAPWTLAMVIIIAFPVFAHWLAALLRTPRRANWRNRLALLALETSSNLARALLSLLFLPHLAAVSIDAITRALYRRWISHSHRLEWLTAAQAERNTERGITSLYRTMAPALVGAAAIATWAAIRGAWTDAPLIAGWLLAPLVAAWLSGRTQKRPQRDSAVERHFLRRLGRRTWRYFDELVTEADHYLPPDNIQEDPPVLARRTSPTNIGMSLLSNLAAYDLGYIGLADCAERLDRTLATVEKLELYRGHLLNWYDTGNLQPLLPRYISTVDSGNLAGVLWCVKQACLAPRGGSMAEGYLDTLRLVDDELAVSPDRRLDEARTLVQSLLALFGTTPPKLTDLTDRTAKLEALVTAVVPPETELHTWATALQRQLDSHRRDVGGSAEADQLMLQTRLTRIAARADALAAAMDFTFLYQPEREVFSIGFDVQAGRIDNSYYDLLASEARLASFVAIAKGDVPVAHWFRLGRPFVQIGLGQGLMSWTGTMFEYLMPTLLTRSYPDTLLDQTCRSVVQRQIAYGRERRVPWGISESAYNARDLHLNYQYGPFGVPGLGIKRGLGDDLVVAPYASALALAVDPHAAVENLWRLRAAGLEGRYGMYESIDYTPERVPEGAAGHIIRAFMAHHQGMTLTAIAEHLCGQRMIDRFHAEPMVKATELLLQERIPREAVVEDAPDETIRRTGPLQAIEREPWRPFVVDEEPVVDLLSNGSYSVMLTGAGGGYSRCRNLAVSRWREDPTRDHWGQFYYLRDVRSGRVWSAAHQPTLVEADSYDLSFSGAKAEIRRLDDDIETQMVVSVSTEDNAEIRALTLTNHATTAHTIDVTSYAEVVLLPPAADSAHPAFGALFVETEYLPDSHALLATRRRRDPSEPEVWAFHVSLVERGSNDPVSYETDRVRFLGRGRTPQSPIAMTQDLSNTTGAVLDPIFSLRRQVELAPGETVRVLFTTAVTDSRAQAVTLASKYVNVVAANRASALAWTHTQAQLHYLDLGAAEARVFMRVAARLVYANRWLRARDEVLTANDRGQTSLWRYGVSGDLPIALARVGGEQHIELVREMLRAHEYWCLRGLTVDLVILNEHPPTYSQSFQDLLQSIVRSGPGAALLDKPGGIFIRRSDVMPPEDTRLFLAAARVVFQGGRGTVAEQLDRDRRPKGGSQLPAQMPRKPLRLVPQTTVPSLAPLSHFNGLGGFSSDGKEYVIRLDDHAVTPAPWCNVIANARFGTLISERGGGYEWADNCHENRLTAWGNDAVIDAPTSQVYLRDEASGEVWTPTDGARTVRHGQGYTVFERASGDLTASLSVFVAADDPVKISRLVLRNTGRSSRRISVTGYVEWTLGVEREKSAPYVVTSIDDRSGAVLAKNAFATEPGVAFALTVPAFESVTGDRAEFLGHHGDPANPAALRRVSLSGRVGAGLDPCAAMQLTVTIEPSAEREILVILGQGSDLGEARAICERYRAEGAAARAFDEVCSRWDDLLGRIQIDTPDHALNLICNRWLLYQLVSSRLWGRTGFYQSGGAYGFRDQLQDVAALVYSRPELARQHLLRAAARQFHEGDVQHWWHPPSGKGVRTRFADDFLWLPFIAAHYLAVTADTTLLDEPVPFIEARALEPGEAEVYLTPTVSDDKASFYEHLTRALDHGLTKGPHGLPLMGAGDWNDGMNRVGIGGQGESVWLGWFLIEVLQQILPHCDRRGDGLRATRYRSHLTDLKAALEQHAWDGDWYLRAFFDDGTPLGSHSSDECRIDSISQSWSVISGAGDKAHQRRAMASVDSQLVDRASRLVKLLSPPFDHTAHDPGYIKGYIPGVRENGGQYTHAGAWVALAFTHLGDGDRAAEILSMLNPITRSADKAAMQTYRVEPYAVAGDVFTVGPHTGRGGWTWYTGSASWLYRVTIESLLGLTISGDRLTIHPIIPRDWPGFKLTYRHQRTTFVIQVVNVGGTVVNLTVDGKPASEIVLVDDGGTHQVRVTLDAEQVRRAGA